MPPVNRNRASDSEHPEKSRKRPRVPKFHEANQENEAEAQAPQDDDEEEEDLQEDLIEEGGFFVEDIYIPPKMSISERPTHGERLIIEKIECENFKSYGGIKVMGPFHKSFSAIIGPNGNGKSNIIDAMLFVFGYRAKKIRCKKVSVLIHKSELLPAVSSCAVTVHFLKIIDNGEEDDQLNIVPDSKIKVCRRAYRNNTSAYWLNSKRVQFTEVASFLKKSGIDIVHNRFLILQGEVEQIAQMPPKASNTHETGFLEFIDEIIGTKRYEKPLQKLKDRIEELDFQREEKSQRVTLAEQHKNSLIEPMKKATAFLRDRNTKIRTNHTLNQVKAFSCRKSLENKKEKLQELEQQRSAIQTRLDEIKAYNDERRSEYVEAEKAYQIAEAKFKKNKKTLDDADAKYVQLNREMKTSNEERKKKLEEIKKVETELEKLHGLPERHAADIEKLEKRKEELENDIRKEDEATKGDIERVNKLIEQAVTEKKKADAELRKKKNMVDEKKVAMDTLKKELSRGKDAEAAENAKLEKMQKELEELVNVVKRKSGQGLNISAEDIAAKDAEAKRLKREAFELTNKEIEKRNALMTLRNQYGEAIENAEGGKMTDRVDKAMFSAKAQGQFPGLYGRLKDLASIDEKYNIAATVATGMLDYWVVDNDSTGAECIQFLKDNRLPSQTFVCVSKMGHLAQQCKNPFRTPANSLRIFDLLKISRPELAPVYYKAYHNTLVAENLDIATQVAYGGQARHRVVTCQGDIVESTGSLVGGGAKPSSGKFNSEMSRRLGNAMSKQQLEALKKRLDAAEKEFAQVSNRKKELENEAFNIEKEIAEAKAKIANFQSDMEASKRMIPMKEQMIRQQEEKVRQTTIPDKILKEKTKRIEEAEAEFESAKEPYEEAEEQVKTLADKINSLNEDKKKEILKKLNKFKDQLKRVKDEINKLNIELKNFEKNKTKAETKKTKLKDEVQALQDKMLEMAEEKKSLEANAVKLKAEEEALKIDKEEKEKIYTELKSKANEFDKEEKKLNKDKVVVDNNFQALSDDIRVREKEERGLVASLSGFALSEIPETEIEPLEIFTEEQLAEMNVKELEARLAKYTNKLKREEPNLNIIDDYNKACETLLKRIGELDAVNVRRETFNTAYLTLEAQRMKEFMEGFSQISTKVKELFRMISMGGDAELDLVDTTDPFTCGIDFSVRPRGKTWKKIINLSGGEKTLSSLALVFSLHHFKPSPFYVMDEIDAALDFQNVSIIANYIKDRTKFTQFIIISLRSNMFELADSLLGVYKVDNMSYSIRIGVNSVVNKLKGAHLNENRPYLMGFDDHNSAASRSKQTTGVTTTAASQATTVPLSQGTTVQLSQGNTVQLSQGSTVPAGTANKKPSLDISAIRDPNSTADTEKLSQASNQPPKSASECNGRSSKDSGHPQSDNPEENGNGIEEMDTSQDLFESSFNQEQAIVRRGRAPVPIASSTPCTTATRGRTAIRQAAAELSGVQEEEEAEAGTGSDESNASALSDALSSLNSSVNNSQSQP